MESSLQESMPPSRRSTGDTLKSDSSASSPLCTQSSTTFASIESTSNSSSSPVGPVTPPNRTDRVRSRYYGDLGRVPLHRRGTSKTYERLEDLLKEAGYKETRVFTPEAERAQAAGEEDQQKPEDPKTTGMGVVVDFLTNLFPVPGKHPRQQSTDETESEYSPPRSPLGDRGRIIQSPVTPGEQTSSVDECDDDETPRPTRQVSEARPRPPPAYRGATLSSRNSQASLQPRFGAPNISSRPSETSLYRTSLAHPRPSRAKAYLRHMASSTSIQGPQRPNSTPVHSTHSMKHQARAEKPHYDTSIIYGRRGNGEGE